MLIHTEAGKVVGVADGEVAAGVAAGVVDGVADGVEKGVVGAGAAVK